MLCLLTRRDTINAELEGGVENGAGVADVEGDVTGSGKGEVDFKTRSQVKLFGRLSGISLVKTNL